MHFSLSALEYQDLKALLGAYVSSDTGREILDRIEPVSELSRLESQHALNQEAIEYLRENRVSFADIPRLPLVRVRLRVSGSTLSVLEIEAVGNLLAEIGGFRQRWSQEEAFPRLRAKGLRFPDLSELETLLGRAIRDGQVSEDYSPALKNLRQQLEKARAQLQRKLEKILKSPDLKGQLQEQIVTVRNGRYVIPVRSDQKRTVAGIVHGSSSSGATVFMEPLDTLEMNNALVRLEEEEAREVQRILGEVTDRIRADADALDQAANLWFEMEVLFGIARFARDFDCVIPRFSKNRLGLAKARHPLLEAKLRGTDRSVVGLTLETDAQGRLLVISGPNAGGKTVVLKTLGLLTLMAQSGLPVPAESAQFPLADRVLADIGDQQSISDQLSTFSAHIVQISAMVEAATGDSLILLDEIGSSTEPAEGAALAIAVLEHFRDAGARVVATTHYNRLKMYAETTPGVRNASMEFDDATLKPTYRLLDGLAGQSSGLEIAERFGLPSRLIETARRFLDQSEIDAARYVEELQARIHGLEDERNRLEEERKEFQSWQDQVAARVRQDLQTERERAEKRLDSLVAKIRSRAEREVERLGSEAQKKIGRAVDRARDAARRELGRPDPSMASATERVAAELQPEGGTRVRVHQPEGGTRVRIHSMGVEGIVLDVREDSVEIAVGSMKVQRPLEDLTPVGPARIRLPENVRFETAAKTIDSNEINLIGCSSDEALERLDKFLDDAFLGQLPSVRIIHGSGMGVLRRSIGEFLESHPHVCRFEFAPSSQGGRGVTIASLND